MWQKQISRYSLKKLNMPLKLQSPWRTSARHYTCPKTMKHTRFSGTQYSKLHNGLTVATQTRAKTPYACIGLYIDAGSRYESDPENGLVHFFEHLVFQNTNKREALELRKIMGETGGNFRCFTTRDMACYYVQCLKEHIPVATDILCDCVFNNALSEDEMKKQKAIVYYEMLKYDSDQNALLYDYLHGAAFQGTPLGQSVMGPSTNLHRHGSYAMNGFMLRYFNPIRTVLAAVGDVVHEDILGLANCHLNCLKPRSVADCAPYRYTGSDVRYRDDSMPFANVLIAVEGSSWCHPDNVIMEIARSAVGGWDRSQVFGDLLPGDLARTASEEKLCEAYKAFNINYKDTGLWGVQFISDVMNVDNMSTMIQGEWMYLCTSITENELERAKSCLKTELILKMQSATEACHDLGRWTLYVSNQPALAEKLTAIDRVDVGKFREVCTRYLYDRCPTVAAVGRTEGLMEYQRIRSGMFWLRC